MYFECSVCCWGTTDDFWAMEHELETGHLVKGIDIDERN